MFRLDTQSIDNKAHRSEDQKGIARRKRPHRVGLIIIQLTLVALISGLFVPAMPAYALSGSHDSDLRADGSGSFSAKTGEMGADAGFGYSIPYRQAATLDVAIISTPWATVDSNGEPGPDAGGIPEAFVVEAAVTNTGDAAATNVVVTLDYNQPGDWVLLEGEDTVRSVEELASGETFYAYWFASYPQDDSGVGHEYTVTASADNANSITTPQNFYEPDLGWTVQTRSTISSGNSRVTQTSADIVVGVKLTIVQETYLGNNPDDITFSPVGNADFDPSAYRLLTAKVRFFDEGNTQEEIITDHLYFPADEVPDFGDSKIWAEVTYTFLPVLPANTTLCPYAAIDFGSNPKYDENFCSDGTQIPITGTITLSLTKQVSSQTVEQGQPLIYTIDYANNGDQPLQYAWVWDDVPAGVSIVSSSISPSSDPDETTDTRVAWNLGPIPVASTGVLTFEVLVDGDGQDLADGTSLVNSAFFGIDPGRLPQRAALTSTVTTEVQAPTVSVTKTDGKDIAGPGDPLTYEVRITNSGTTAATGLVITDVLPSEVTLAGTTTPAPPTSQDGQTLVWNDVTISPGETYILRIPVVVASNVTHGMPIENTATVAYRNTPGHTYAEKVATDTTTARVPELTFTKSAEDVDGSPLVVGDAILYTLQVTNTGTYTGNNVVVTDDLPEGVTYVGASADKGTVQESNGTVNWTIPELAAQSDNVATLLITVTLDDGTEGQTIVNTGSVTGDNVPNPPDDPTPVCPDGSHPDPSGECLTTPTPRDTELAFTKTAEDLNGPPIGTGDAILYTLQVTNVGTYTAYNVTVTDDLPELVTCQAVSGDSAPIACDDPLEWTIPSLAPGVTASLYITVTIDAEAEDQTIVNTGSVTGDNVPNPPDDPTPVCPDGSTPVNEECPSTPVPGTSLALAKTAEDLDGPPVLVGDTIRYTLHVTNTGTYTAYNVTVTDDLPDQVTCQDVSGDSPPAGCADPLIWSIPSLAPGITASLHIDVTINPGTQGQSITNTASVTGGNVPNPPDDPTPVCPDGSLPVGGICEISPEPAPGGGIFLPIIMNNFR